MKKKTAFFVLFAILAFNCPAQTVIDKIYDNIRRQLQGLDQMNQINMETRRLQQLEEKSKDYHLIDTSSVHVPVFNPAFIDTLNEYNRLLQEMSKPFLLIQVIKSDLNIHHECVSMHEQYMMFLNSVMQKQQVSPSDIYSLKPPVVMQLCDELSKIPGIESQTSKDSFMVCARIPANDTLPSVGFSTSVFTYSEELSTYIRYKNYAHLGNMYRMDTVHNSKETIIASLGFNLSAVCNPSVAVLLQLANYLSAHPAIKHGDVYLYFTYLPPKSQLGSVATPIDSSWIHLDSKYYFVNAINEEKMSFLTNGNPMSRLQNQLNYPLGTIPSGLHDVGTNNEWTSLDELVMIRNLCIGIVQNIPFSSWLDH